MTRATRGRSSLSSGKSQPTSSSSSSRTGHDGASADGDLERSLEHFAGKRFHLARERSREENGLATKFNRLLELLGQLFNDEGDARALIFVERQESADKLFVELKNKNYTCMPLHGGREQIDTMVWSRSICSRPPCKGIHV
jgi:superfamily II DNA/RNA helicase